MDILISGRYAKALFDIASAENKLEIYHDDVLSLKNILCLNPNFEKSILNPKVTLKEKINLVNSSFQNKINQNILSLLFLLIKKNRFSFTVPILEQFLELSNTKQKKVTAYIQTATSLNERQQIAISRILSDKLQKIVTLDITVNEKLIAGMKITIGQTQLDTSIKNELETMKLQFLS